MKQPRDPKTKQELLQREQPGYYPYFSTLSQKEHWDEATRVIIEHRIEKKETLHFFTASEAQTLSAVLDCLLPQTDRDPAHQIPLLPAIDERLWKKKFDGYIYEGTLEEDASYRLGLSCLDTIAQKTHQLSFHELAIEQREPLLLALREDNGGPFWLGGDRLPGNHFWSLLIQDAVGAYYAHPKAWDEIGFGGPAYPRGYMRAVDGLPEPWEKDEARYEWIAPEESISDSFKENKKLYSGSGQHGQAGSH